MPDQTELFKRDLRLLPNVERENDRFPGADLPTRETDQGFDLETVEAVPNLQQALLMRFLTPKGSLTHLGHPEYGSNLFKLIGEPNTETNRNRAKLYTLEALAQEVRIAEVLEVFVATNRRLAPTRVEISARLRAIGEEDPVTVTVPLDLV